MKRIQLVAGAVALASTLAFGAAASATDYNISAVTNGFGSGNPVLITLGPGTYSLSAIGQADNPTAYNAWSSTNCGTACVDQWQWGYGFFSSGTQITFIGANGLFATDLLALNNAKTTPNLGFGVFDIPTMVFTPGSVPNPFIFTLATTSTFGGLINDPDGNYLNNQGGVSIRITAVPEPATWAMMILGLGLTGLALRRRRALAAIKA